jgi:hypothetical protein
MDNLLFPADMADDTYVALFLSLSVYASLGGQDIQSRFRPGHAAGKAGVVGAAFLLEMLYDALAMG